MSDKERTCYGLCLCFCIDNVINKSVFELADVIDTQSFAFLYLESIITYCITLLFCIFYKLKKTYVSSRMVGIFTDLSYQFKASHNTHLAKI